jgi:FtsP/CotA-like multicopper oxidase with cupredoxin domain
MTMRYKEMLRIFGGMILLLAVLAGGAGTAGAAEYWLWAAETSKTMQDGQAVPVWGFCQDTDNNLGGAIDCTPTVPGPRIVVPPGENLTIHLKNALAEPVSLNILGQTLTNNAGPVWTSFPGNVVTSTGNRTGADATSRVRSFSHETAPGATADYVWGAFQPGTYLLQSGTNPAKQVQM